MLFLRAVFSTFIVCLYTSNKQLTSAYRNFYWREWNGTIPHDAVPGGIIDGVITYIGSSFFPANNGILLSTITENSNIAKSNIADELKTTSDKTMILCAAADSQPVWKKVTLVSMFTSECKFIKVGYLDETDLYIGRKKEGNNIFIGRVFPAEHKASGLEYWYNKMFARITEFEALGYCDCICPCNEIVFLTV